MIVLKIYIHVLLKHKKDWLDVSFVFFIYILVLNAFILAYKANWQKMAAALDSLGQSFQLDHSSAPVKSAIAQSANVLHKIGAQHEEHGKTTTEQLMDFIYTYKGVLSGIPDVVNIHRVRFFV